MATYREANLEEMQTLVIRSWLVKRGLPETFFQTNDSTPEIEAVMAEFMLYFRTKMDVYRALGKPEAEGIVIIRETPK